MVNGNEETTKSDNDDKNKTIQTKQSIGGRNSSIKWLANTCVQQDSYKWLFRNQLKV